MSQKGIFWYVFHISSSHFPVPSFWSLLVIAADQYIGSFGTRNLDSVDRWAPLRTFALYANCALRPLRLIPLASNSHSPQTNFLSKNIFKLHKRKFFKHGIFIKTASFFFISLSNFWEISLQVNKRKVNIIFFLLLHREQLLMEPIYTKDMKEKCGQQTHCINQILLAKTDCL